ncbi:hypothetical protein HDU87_002497 [Geranomyces variabilis]|uniref:Uncharacterized protein n=1 Tax=Geranomyces variabilis TaxID=109894 RepID=A0AAD5TVY5_9FUNG|nr:hypothetical protein HDU87_002497 [Geranomyces variabilis]
MTRLSLLLLVSALCSSALAAATGPVDLSPAALLAVRQQRTGATRNRQQPKQQPARSAPARATKAAKSRKTGTAANQQGSKATATATSAAGAAATAAPVSGRTTAQPITQFSPSPFCSAANMLPSDGTQIRVGSCSSTAMGAIPSTSNMVSTIITSPAFMGTVDASVDNVVAIDMVGLDTGFFSDPQVNYNKQPQTLNSNGIIQGHQHITIQPLTNAQAAPDSTKFVFFKGLNDESSNGRTLTVTVPKGTFTTNGLHRICSMSGVNAHQPPLMPVAQRGSQDDCIRVTVKNAVAATAAAGK